MFLHAARAVRAAAGHRLTILPPHSRPPRSSIYNIPGNAAHLQSFRTLTFRTNCPSPMQPRRFSPVKDTPILSTSPRLPFSTLTRPTWPAKAANKATAPRGAFRPGARGQSMLKTSGTCCGTNDALMRSSRPFHSSRPSQMPAPLLPVVFSILKTPMTAAVLRVLSRISLTLLPLSTRRSPRVILTLVMIPPICFGLVIAAGLEVAPNTGRWRFLFTSEETEFELVREELPALLATLRIVEDENDERLQLVRHILNNLLKHAIEADGTTLRSFNIEGENNKDAVLAQLAGDGEDGNASLLTKTYAYHSEQNAFVNTLSHHDQKKTKTKKTIKNIKSLNASQEEEDDTLQKKKEKKGILEVLDDPNLVFKDRPFQIYVTEDDEINACSVGPPRLIFVNSGLMEFVENDEDLLAAVIAHEVAHVIQRHTMETHGRETIMLFLADLMRSALWTVSIPLGPWFNSWIDQTTENLLHFTASGPLHQAIEVEADTVSLSLMAMAGYDPIHAVQFWEGMSEVERQTMEREDSVEVHKWTDWMYDHPPSAERARYLKEKVVVARELWERVLQLRDEPVARFRHGGAVVAPKSTLVDEDGDLIEDTADAVLGQLDEDIKDLEVRERQKGSHPRGGGWFSTVKSWFSSANSDRAPAQQAWQPATLVAQPKT